MLGASATFIHASFGIPASTVNWFKISAKMNLLGLAPRKPRPLAEQLAGAEIHGRSAVLVMHGLCGLTARQPGVRSLFLETGCALRDQPSDSPARVSEYFTAGGRQRIFRSDRFLAFHRISDLSNRSADGVIASRAWIE
jgi:hypothetical protein